MLSCSTLFDRLAADDPAHRGITPEPVGVVDILVAGETPIDGLAKETDDAVPAVPAVRLSASTPPASAVSPSASSSSR